MKKIKKIGILTHSYGSNYGGLFQCVALYKTLKENTDFDIEVINYIPKNAYSLKSLFLSGIKQNNIINIKKFLIKLKYVKSILKKFDKYRKNNLKFSREMTELKELNGYDIIIVGSDQVWNVSGGVEGVPFFLNNIENIYKISYAACSGLNKYREKDLEFLKTNLLKFNKISVRNKHTYDFVKEISNVNSEIVCDPTILYSFDKLIKEDRIIPEKYILTYILGSEIEGGNLEVIKKLKEKHGEIKVIAVGIPYARSGGLQFYPWADEVLYDASPEEWLNLIKNAEVIYTDSYHGVLFSMKFHKSFIGYYAEKNRASRFLDLSVRYEIDNYIVSSVAEIIDKKSLEKEIDYTKIDLLLEKHKKSSMKFLKNALGEE